MKFHVLAGAAIAALLLGTVTSEQARADDSISDHSLFVGSFGVGLFGAQSVPIGIDGNGNARDINAPVVGMRYWFSEGIGLDIALGLGLSSGSQTVNNVSSSTESSYGFSLHAGLPVALTHAGHYKFLLTPFMSFATGGGTIPGQTVDFDTFISGFRFDVGARIGAEIHFGFIGVPQLALQASVGAGLTYTSRTRDVGNGPGQSPTVSTTSGLNVSTTVNNRPWDIFMGNISAIYYF